MGTPIPIQIEFPWNTQEFFGDQSVYSWGHGYFIWNPLGIAFRALKDWAFNEINSGRPLVK